MASATILSDNGVTSGSAGLKTGGGNDGTLLLQTTTAGGVATTAVAVDNAQNVGVGVTPSAWNSAWKVIQNQGGFIGANTTSSQLVASNAYSDGTNWRYVATGYSTSYTQVNGTHSWNSAPSGSAAGVITYTGVLAVGKGTSLALEGASSVAGTGITFPATQSASSDVNTLDDYEEGTWTPVLSASTTPPTVGYSYRSGVYRKIGNMVYVQFAFNLSSVSGGSGEMVITGLPFTSVARGPYQEPANSMQGGGWVTAAYAGQTYCFIADSSTSLYGRYQNNSDTAISISQFQAGTYFNAMIIYLATS
jgi:hypothetical protein